MTGHQRVKHLIAATVVALTATACRLEFLTGVPRFDLLTAGGCGDILVYKASADRKEVVVVSANVRQFAAQTNPLVFDLKTPPAGLEVRVDMYPTRRSSLPYCNDVVDGSEPQPTEWRAIEGRVTITLQRTGLTVPYRAIVRLEDAVFESRGRRTGQGAPIDIEAMVGWYAG